MILGVPKEMMKDEYRVAIVPAGVRELTSAGHTVIIESGAGEGSGISDSEYLQAGAQILSGPAQIWNKAEIILKVKQPLPSEYPFLRRGQIVCTFFHFAADEKLTLACLKAGIIAVAYETIRDKKGRHPILTPMSEIAGRMSVQEGAKYLESPMMGKGVLLSGVAGVSPAHIVILGGGVVGSNAAKIASALGARVTILDVDLDRLRYLDDIMPKNVVTLKSDHYNIRAQLKTADLVIGAVLIEGARTPLLLRREDLAIMQPRSVIVDVAVDQGGCFETSRPTTHSEPTFTVDDIIHYCVANIPGAVGRTSTQALANVTLPYFLEIAEEGHDIVSTRDEGLRHGLNIVEGRLTNRAVAETFGLNFSEL